MDGPNAYGGGLYVAAGSVTLTNVSIAIIPPLAATVAAAASAQRAPAPAAAAALARAAACT